MGWDQDGNRESGKVDLEMKRGLTIPVGACLP
jgi:hypothetical protein